VLVSLAGSFMDEVDPRSISSISYPFRDVGVVLEVDVEAAAYPGGCQPLLDSFLLSRPLRPVSAELPLSLFQYCF